LKKFKQHTYKASLVRRHGERRGHGAQLATQHQYDRFFLVALIVGVASALGFIGVLASVVMGG
jgi:hypothetical protein